MIIAHSTYSDSIYAIRDDFPEILWSFTGSGNEGRGGNGYWLDVLPHEAAYLAGIAAGHLNETGIIGSVAAFPFPNVNGPVNGFLRGGPLGEPRPRGPGHLHRELVRSSRGPGGRRRPHRGGRRQPLRGLNVRHVPGRAGGGPGYSPSATWTTRRRWPPRSSITSVLILWDPGLNVLIDEWWAHETAGEPYDAPTERIHFYMAEGRSRHRTAERGP